MNPGDRFREAHEKWKNRGKAVLDQDEQLRTWLMSKSGHYFPFDGGALELKKMLGLEFDIFCIYFNATSLYMAGEQAVIIAKRTKR